MEFGKFVTEFNNTHIFQDQISMTFYSVLLVKQVAETQNVWLTQMFLHGAGRVVERQGFGLVYMRPWV